MTNKGLSSGFLNKVIVRGLQLNERGGQERGSYPSWLEGIPWDLVDRNGMCCLGNMIKRRNFWKQKKFHSLALQIKYQYTIMMLKTELKNREIDPYMLGFERWYMGVCVCVCVCTYSIFVYVHTYVCVSIHTHTIHT